MKARLASAIIHTASLGVFFMGKETLRGLDGHGFFGVPARIPAGRESGVRKQGIGAGLLVGGFINVFGAAIFLLDGIVHLHGNTAERIAITKEAVAKRTEVRSESEYRRRANCDPQSKKNPLHLPAIK
jgi:hypothetical protein